MSDDADRLLRIKSLINRDMQSVRGKAPVQPSQQAAEGVLQQRKQQLEAQDLALREKAQQQRQQRQMQHRQHLLAEKAQKAALKEQRQKQEALRLQKEHAERLKIQRQMRTTVPSPQEARAEKNLEQEKNAQGNTKRNTKGEVLELTNLARQGPSPQQRAALSRKDARLYSPFAHTKPIAAASQRGFVRSLAAGVFAFLIDPFLLLWRSILWPYRILRSVPSSTDKPNFLPRQAPRHQLRGRTPATALLACWHFATAPLHLLAHAVIDPWGMFTRQPHNYPRLSLGVYARIFVQQIQRNFLILLHGAGHLAQAFGRFLAAPFLLLARIVLMPWRSLRYGSGRNVAAMLGESSAGSWRRARIRSIGFLQIFSARMLALLRAQRGKLRSGKLRSENLHKRAGEVRSLVGRFVRKRMSKEGGSLSVPSSWRSSWHSSWRSLWRFLCEPIGARGSRKLFGNSLGNSFRKSFGKPFRKSVGSVGKSVFRRRAAVARGQDSKASLPEEEEEKSLSAMTATTDKTGLFASSEHSLLEDFFASEEEAEKSEGVAAAQEKKVEDEKVEDKEKVEDEKVEDQKVEDQKVEAKEKVYQDMDNLRSALEGDSRGEPDEEHVFQEIEGLDEQARAKLLQRLSKRVASEKLR